MLHRTVRRPHAFQIVAHAVLLLTAGTVAAQERGVTRNTPDPSPYYLGASQGFTHDSNVYRIPNGPADNYSSTSLLAGFDQRISRQRVFGTASVALNRYQDQTRLNNTSYDLLTGINWETINSLSGNVIATLNRGLSAPVATVAAPTPQQNIAQRRGVSGLVKWGGQSLLSIEGRLGYSTVDYSATNSAASESKNVFGSLGLFYSPSPLLRVGTALREERTQSPRAVLQPNGSYTGSEVKSRSLDLLANYELSGKLRSDARLSYTKQTSDLGTGDFSGLTGGLGLSYQATGKISLNLSAARDAGFDNGRTGTYVTFVAGAPNTPPVATLASGLYENNRVTNSLGVGATYAATAKINVNAGFRYARARLTSTSVTGAGTLSSDIIDTSKVATLGASYAIARAWTLSCNLSHETREVSGGVAYSYDANTIGCLAQFLWR